MISVIIPLYNKKATIKRTVESVLAQTFQDFEIIIVNDGSTDGSAEVVENIRSDKIRIVHQANQGVSAARNRGLLEANYNWLALLDGDDEWHADYLESVYNATQEDSGCIVYCTGYIRVSLQGEPSSVQLRYIPADSGRLACYYKSSFFGAPIVTSSSVCLNRSILKREKLLALFPVGTKSGEDLDAWVRLALKGDVYFINRELAIINTVNVGISHVSNRLSGEFNYVKWLAYRCNSYYDRLWLTLYALKKLYEMSKKYAVVRFPWLYRFYVAFYKKLSIRNG